MGEHEVSQGHVASTDGTEIGFRRQGNGPGLVLIQGAMGTAYDYRDIARALSSTFTVYVPDRRGRGMSQRPYDSSHDIARDVEDVDTILTHAGSSRVFGLSSGAVIALEAARTLPRITRAAVYEPPFYPHGMSHQGIELLNSQIERGHLASALVTSLRVAQTAPAPLRVLPQPAARLLAAAVLRLERMKSSPHATLSDLLPGIRYDFNVVGGMDGKIEVYAALAKPVLLLSGTKSPAFLRQSIKTLEEILPQARRIDLVGLDHSGPWNTGRGGHPDLVAFALQQNLV